MQPRQSLQPKPKRQPQLQAQRQARAQPRGIALVLVMWVLSLLTVMALALTQIQRTEGALTANQLESARFRAQANAVLNLLALNLLSTPATPFEDAATFGAAALNATAFAGAGAGAGAGAVDETHAWIPDGQPRTLEWDNERFIVTLSNEGSKINLNAISREQLGRLIALAQGDENPDEQLRDQLADAMLDWRDQNDLALLNGAEDPDYASAGLPYGAADRPFRSVEELRQVLGMPAVIYQRLAPSLTVEETGGQVDQAFAAAPVLAVLNGYLLEDAQRLVEERSQGLFGEAEAEAEANAPQRAPLDRGGPLYHIQVTQQRLSGRGPTMQALIRLEPGGQSAFETLWQRFGISSASPGLAAD
ncbi:general secretion pathway protein GspK [Halochromatium roseum]|uniref:general secretion pathway protein GspK n=1 Tax=Halochromatium roseum TaxID=391920 RepID=UPI0019135032|nr:type II secretion system protein GspK [Halochromatium roseum]